MLKNWDTLNPDLEFPWNQSTAMALKIAVERNSCNKTLIILLLWIFDKLETCLRISLVVFSKKTETNIVIYAWFDQHLNSSIKVVIVMHSEIAQ
jgi:hypothetical protein